MNKIHKIIAWTAAFSLVAMNLAFAATTFTNSVTWGTGNVDVVWDGTYNSGTIVNATGSTNVVITANVAPTLTMTSSTGSIDFGTLALGSNTGSMTLTTATNAEGWINISMASNWLESSSRYIWSYTANGRAATTWAFSYQVVSVSNQVGAIDKPLSPITNVQDILTTSNVADSNQTLSINLVATINAQTEAWNYGDTLTYTVTGNF